MYPLIFLLLSTLSFAAVQVEDHSLIYESYVLEKSGKVKDAIERVKKVMGSESDSYALNMRMGHLYTIEKDLDKATTFFIRAGALKPKSLEPWIILMEYFFEKDIVRGKNYAGEILTRDPFHKEAAEKFLEACVKTNSHNSGLDQSEESLKAWPSHLVFLEQKAFFLAKLGKKAEAKSVIVDLLLLDPDNAYARKFMSTEN
jgi:tetratricopeptide (TPR) repeat protein